jgi:hypothetical protein
MIIHDVRIRSDESEGFLSGSRGGGGAPESTEAKWLAFLVLLGVVGLAIWFAARWIVVVPLLVWANLNYSLLDLAGLLDPAGRRWGDYARQALGGLFEGRFGSNDFEWSTHLQPLHLDVSARTLPFWLGLFGVMTIVILFHSRGGGLTRSFSLTGLRKAPVFRLFGLPIRNAFARGTAKLLASLLLVRRLVTSERKEWERTSPSFLGYQSLAWKTSMVSTRFRPDTRNIPAPARTPAEWVLENVKGPNGRDRIPVEEFISECRRAMEVQLGQPWRGWRKAPAHVQALFGLMYVNRHRGEAESRKVAESLSSAFVSGSGRKRDKALLEVVRPVLADPKFSSRVDKWTSRHAWTNTAVIGVYGRCGPFQDWGGGDAGVLPTASFLWLKEIDRFLWYALNNVGRRAFHVEGAGAICHFFHERIADQPLETPMFDEAIMGTTSDGKNDRTHGILGYLIDNQMMPDRSVVDLTLIRSIIRREEE